MSAGGDWEDGVSAGGDEGPSYSTHSSTSRSQKLYRARITFLRDWLHSPAVVKIAVA